MRQYVYDPPMGSPPLVAMINGGPKIVFPPDQAWKLGKKKRRIGVKFDPFGNVAFERFVDTDEWQVDEERTKAQKLSGVTPDNTIWLDDSDFAAFQRGKYAPLNQYLQPVQQIHARLRQTRAQLEQEHDQQMAKLREMFEREKQAIMDTAAQEILKLKASEAQVIENAAQEIGTTADKLEKVLKKHKDEQTKARKAERAGANA